MKTIDLITVNDPKSPIAEAYRTLRTNIQFSSFDKDIKVVVVTSSGPGEGKSTTSSNLAVTMAENGKKTILIDCDQRKPKLHKLFEISNNCGLSDVLAGKTDFETAVQKSQVSKLDLLTSGTKPPNPSELLASHKMKTFIESLRKSYDFIILDTPPVIAVTDAQLLSTHADGCILVLASSQVEIAAAMKSKELLDKVNAKILGVVLNKLDVSDKAYYGHYYHYYYGEDGEKVKKKKEKRD